MGVTLLYRAVSPRFWKFRPNNNSRHGACNINGLPDSQLELLCQSTKAHYYPRLLQLYVGFHWSSVMYYVLSKAPYVPVLLWRVNNIMGTKNLHVRYLTCGLRVSLPLWLVEDICRHSPRTMEATKTTTVVVNDTSKLSKTLQVHNRNHTLKPRSAL